MADALASGASVLIGRAGSSPAPGTVFCQVTGSHPQSNGLVFLLPGKWSRGLTFKPGRPLFADFLAFNPVKPGATVFSWSRNLSLCLFCK